MKSTYRVLAYIIAGLVVLQAVWIALSSFTAISAIEAGKTVDENAGGVGGMLHGLGGMYAIPLVTIVLLVVSFFARVAGGVKWALFILLAVAVQIVLAFLSFGVPQIGALHGLNAFVIIALSVIAGTRAGRQLAAGRTGAPASEPADKLVA
ncbi:MAG TPA: hypothetical protein VF053_18255 [Streptosporangiales bacterium]